MEKAIEIIYYVAKASLHACYFSIAKLRAKVVTDPKRDFEDVLMFSSFGVVVDLWSAVGCLSGGCGVCADGSWG
ncbi:hypothetical protein L484_012303 [Morus notabilis]|uniref:Uncharacterized protein n=1 Tax=Morus notabilis TaxID=981085 RepID=W9QLV5_9ROSA|nr:hypothetical protein L484_012303 [Morus notabilis]